MAEQGISADVGLFERQVDVGSWLLGCFREAHLLRLRDHVHRGRIRSDEGIGVRSYERIELQLHSRCLVASYISSRGTRQNLGDRFVEGIPHFVFFLFWLSWRPDGNRLLHGLALSQQRTDL